MSLPPLARITRPGRAKDRIIPSALVFTEKQIAELRALGHQTSNGVVFHVVHGINSFVLIREPDHTDRDITTAASTIAHTRRPGGPIRVARSQALVDAVKSAFDPTQQAA